jgi:hypothetical protein
VDPDQVFAEATRRALTPEEAGRLLARFPLFWWDHVLCLLGTGLRWWSRRFVASCYLDRDAEASGTFLRFLYRIIGASKRHYGAI